MFKYRFSDNRRFHSDGHDYIFLAADNTIFEMDERIHSVISQTGLPKKFTRTQLFSSLGYDIDDQDELFSEVLKAKVIMPVNSDRHKKKFIFEDFNIDLQTLVFHVTDTCNLGCRYCYYDNAEKNPVSQKTMSYEVAKQAIDFLFEHCGSLKEVIIVFFGGEPLLNMKLISFVVSTANKKAEEKEIKINYALTTNATLLTEKNIDFLRKNKIGVTISIDGFEEAHDRYRCFTDGAPSYKFILPGIKKLISNRGDKPVVARATVAGAASNIRERLEHLLGIGFSEAGFAPVTTGDPSYQLSVSEMDHLLEQFKDLSKTFITYAKKGDFYGFTNLVDNLVVLHEGDKKDYPCGAGLGLFSVDSSGSLYLCQRLTGHPSSRMGNVFSGFDTAALKAFRESANISKKKDCQTCWARQLCAGGCYHEALVREGSLMQANYHYCQWIKEWVQTGLEVYGQLAAETPQYLDKLSMMRGHAPLYTRPI